MAETSTLKFGELSKKLSITNKEIIANSFKDYIDDLKDVLGIKD